MNAVKLVSQHTRSHINQETTKSCIIGVSLVDENDTGAAAVAIVFLTYKEMRKAMYERGSG